MTAVIAYAGILIGFTVVALAFYFGLQAAKII
jgi:hypothetical protein